MNIYLIYLLATVLFAAGASKLSGMEMHKTHFKHWNLPPWSMQWIGGLEVLTAVWLVIPATQFIGLALSAFLMTGAILLLLVMSQYKQALIPTSVLLLSSALLWSLAPFALASSVILSVLAVTLLIGLILFAYPTTPNNKEGEIEYLNEEVAVTHRFKEVLGVEYHYVTAGNPANPALLMVHGAPESWYSWVYQIIDLSKNNYIIAVDMKPYGQTGNDLDGDHSHNHIANELKALLDALGIDQVNLMSHDRGVIATDHLLSKEGMTTRVQKYVRMQQSFVEPHGDPVPPHQLMGTIWASVLYKVRFAHKIMQKTPYYHLPIDPKLAERLDKEFKFDGIPASMPLSFKTTSFAKELEDRHAYLFNYMTMPVLQVQGKYDPGQHPEEYFNIHETVPTSRVAFIEAGHFCHEEAPEEVNEAVGRFLREEEEIGRRVGVAERVI